MWEIGLKWVFKKVFPLRNYFFMINHDRILSWGGTFNQLFYNESCQLLLRTLFFGFYKFWLQVALCSTKIELANLLLPLSS